MNEGEEVNECGEAESDAGERLGSDGGRWDEEARSKPGQA